MCTTQMYRVVDYSTERRPNQKDPSPFRVFFVKGADHEKLYGKWPFEITAIPCGNCKECRIQKSMEWAFRCMKEAKEYENNIMINLTYDDEHIPKSRQINPKTGEFEPSYTLCKEDVQKFIDRLRKHWERHYNHKKVVDESTGEVINPGIRYYMCGEYGSDEDYIDWKGNVRTGTERPHYHIIFFNLKVEDMKFWKWSICEYSKQKNALYLSKTISKLWPEGHADLNEVNYETCAYVARYVMKKIKGEKSEEYYEMKGKVPEYNCMSRKPGIGYAFYERNKEKFENEETFWQVTKQGLKEMRNIRYFDKQIEKNNPEKFEEIKKHREELSKEYWQQLLEKTDISKEQYIKNRVSKLNEKYKKLKRTLAS